MFRRGGDFIEVFDINVKSIGICHLINKQHCLIGDSEKKKKQQH